MASVVFLRGVNVGGHKTFRPSALAKEMAALDMVNVGAAGTFVIRQPVRQSVLRAELQRRLTFDVELIICPGRALLQLTQKDSFSAETLDEDVDQFVSVLAQKPQQLPHLPHRQPAGNKWKVQIVTVTPRFALCLRRRLGPRTLYPNEVVEKTLGVSATTRSWNTVLAIRDILSGSK